MPSWGSTYALFLTLVTDVFLSRRGVNEVTLETFGNIPADAIFSSFLRYIIRIHQVRINRCTYMRSTALQGSEIVEQALCASLHMSSIGEE